MSMSDDLHGVVHALAARFRSRLGPGLIALLKAHGCNKFYMAGGCAHRRFEDVDIFPHPDFLYELATAAVQAGETMGGVLYRDTVKFDLDGLKYQLCPCAYHPDLNNLITGFDFSHVQIGAEIELKPEGVEISSVAWTAGWLRSAATQTTEFNPECKLGPRSSLRRIDKVAAKLDLHPDEVAFLRAKIQAEIVGHGDQFATAIEDRVYSS